MCRRRSYANASVLLPNIGPQQRLQEPDSCIPIHRDVSTEADVTSDHSHASRHVRLDAYECDMHS